MTEEENRYNLSPGVVFSLIESEDWVAVAEDLRNMGRGQECFIVQHSPNRREDHPKVRAEKSRYDLTKALGGRARNYELEVEPDDEGGGYTFTVRRIK